jgi:hypothetical protein
MKWGGVENFFKGKTFYLKGENHGYSPSNA